MSKVPKGQIALTDWSIDLARGKQETKWLHEATSMHDISEASIKKRNEDKGAVLGTDF